MDIFQMSLMKILYNLSTVGAGVVILEYETLAYRTKTERNRDCS